MGTKRVKQGILFFSLLILISILGACGEKSSTEADGK
jgi:hypothetical protein